MEKQRVSKGIYYFVPEKYEDDIEFSIKLRGLSYGELESLSNYLTPENQHQFAYNLCKIAILEIEDADGDLHTISSLPPPVIQETANFIMEMSTVTDEEAEKLLLNVEISMDSTFKGDSWKCEVCQYKKLDRVRNCGYRNEKDKNKDFSVMVGKQLYRYCPIYDLEPQLLDAAIECYIMYDKGIFPDAGGLYDQTRFFVLSSRIFSNKVREEEMKELKKQQKGS